MSGKTTLVVMAAGMGSRFGGLKQIAPVGPNGEMIIDYSVYDAKRAGFDKAVFVIKKEIEKDFREAVGRRIEKQIDVEYAFQNISDLPRGFTVPEGRVKPWGTGQAVIAAESFVNTPFAVINADDFYGHKSFMKVCEHLKSSEEYCMAGFILKNTLTDNGTVSRGICDIENGYLKSVTEHTSIDKNSGFPGDTVVSMNMWGFTPGFFDELKSAFYGFLKNNNNPLKGEFYLPFVVDDLIKNHNKKVRVLFTDDKWYGVTYQADRDTVHEAICKLTESGLYN